MCDEKGDLGFFFQKNVLYNIFDSLATGAREREREREREKH
jgi:hypothetical protein